MPDLHFFLGARVSTEGVKLSLERIGATLLNRRAESRVGFEQAFRICLGKDPGSRQAQSILNAVTESWKNKIE